MRTNDFAAQTDKELMKEINALKTQLKKLSAAIEGEEQDDRLGRVLDKVERQGKQAIDGAIAAAQHFVDEYGDRARERLDALASKSGELRDRAAGTLVENAQTRPFATLAAIAGIGFLAGFLCRRS